MSRPATADGARDLPKGARALDRTARHVATGAPGARVLWRIWGEGAPVVLFHGGHGSWMHWLRVIPALAKRHKVIVPDLPGFGASDPLREISIEAIASALHDGLTALDLPEKFHLGGFSFGCLPAGYLLPVLRPRLHRLILIGSGGFGRIADTRGRLRRWQETPPGLARDTINRENLAQMMFFDPDAIDETAVRIQAYSVENTRHRLVNLAIASDLAGMLAAHPCPLLCVYGEHDALTGDYLEERRSFIAGLAAPTRFETIARCGHWAAYEKPDRVSALILDAMAEDLR